MSGTGAGARRLGPAVRRGAGHARVVGRRVMGRAAAAGRGAARAGRAAIGVSTLPAAVWAAAWRGPAPIARPPAWRVLVPLPAPAALHRALTMPPEESRKRMRALRRQVLSHDVDRWARSFLDALGLPS